MGAKLGNAQPGDATDEVFVEWVRPHWRHMTRFAQRLVGDNDAEDVVQDALTAAWRGWASFDADRGSARTWLLAIVANSARRRLGWLARVSLAARASPEFAPNADSSLERSQLLARDIRAGLAQLTRRQREVVALYYYLDLPVSECAQVLGTSAGTVKSTLSEARARLRAILGEDYS